MIWYYPQTNAKFNLIFVIKENNPPTLEMGQSNTIIIIIVKGLVVQYAVGFPWRPVECGWAHRALLQ